MYSPVETENDWLKHRRLRLGAGSPQARELASRLLPMPGLQAVSAADRHTLICAYDLHHLNLHKLLAKLAVLDATPANDWRQVLQLRLWQYLEHRQLMDHGYDRSWTRCVRQIYISRYRDRRHGRIDDRPQQWRRYLEQDGQDG